MSRIDEIRKFREHQGQWHIGHQSEHDDTVDVEDENLNLVCTAPIEKAGWICWIHNENVPWLLDENRRLREDLDTNEKLLAQSNDLVRISLDVLEKKTQRAKEIREELKLDAKVPTQTPSV